MAKKQKRKYAVFVDTNDGIHLVKNIYERDDPDFVANRPGDYACESGPSKVVRFDDFEEACRDADNSRVVAGVVPVDEGPHFYRCDLLAGEVRFGDPLYVSKPVESTEKLQGEELSGFVDTFKEACERRYARKIMVVGSIDSDILKAIRKSGYSVEETDELALRHIRDYSLVLVPMSHPDLVFAQLFERAVPPPYMVINGSKDEVDISRAFWEGRDERTITQNWKRFGRPSELVDIIKETIGEP